MENISTIAAVSKDGRVSSPAATGAAGTFFEQHVAAYWLALLLVGGFPPILHNCVIKEVHLQAEHLNWQTDDFLIVGQDESGINRRLLGQVKRKFIVSSTDDNCKKTMKDFWNDYNNKQFSKTTDRIVLVTLRGTTNLLEHFASLLEFARVSNDDTDFKHRLTTSGLINSKSRTYFSTIQKIIGEIEGRDVSEEEIWSFLRVLYVLSLDLNTSTRQTESQIKSLLAYTACGTERLSVANASWNELLREVGEKMPLSGSYCRNSLPEVLRQRHTPIGSAEQDVLNALKNHSIPILAAIHTKIGDDIHLGRDRLVQHVLEELESNQVVLLSGPAGSGKSGLAKDAITILSTDHFVFGFRAEEFAHAHFDETLTNSKVTKNAVELGKILACQDRKVLLIDSMERLLENSTRDAFTDLLTFISNDKSWRLVITCRDYSTDLVISGFLNGLGMKYSIIRVPPLDDMELDEVSSIYSMLAPLIANKSIRQLLSNPYMLDKALQIKWSEKQRLPQKDRELREIYWQDIVRANHHPAGGMPDQREKIFVEIALLRARELTRYANGSGLDPQVVNDLKRDSLIVSSPQSTMLLAPAHDILEDWAILHWIEEQYLIHHDSIQAFSSKIGTHPAIRRTYRKWVTEYMEKEHRAPEDLFRAALYDERLPSQFRDDTLISLLRSPHSESFLEMHRMEIFANDKKPLRRIINLLRTACVTTPIWLHQIFDPPMIFNVPEGPAWTYVIRVVQSNLQSLNPADGPLLLGLIEDWAKSINLQDQYPDGAESVASIAYWLIPIFDNYQHEEQLKRTLQIIAKIPKADTNRFISLLRGNKEGKRDIAGEALRKIILISIDGAWAARDMPDEIIQAFKDNLLYSETDLPGEMSYRSFMDIDHYFGIKEGSQFDFYPPSAYHGSFITLLRYHPLKGLSFIIETVNHCADKYAHSRASSEGIEPPYEISLTLSDEKSCTQWCNGLLWNTYRGTVVSPYLLQSMLMALERWLFEFAEAYPDALDTILLYIIRNANSVALTSVAASVATAFPHASGETLIVLLQSKQSILLDRARHAHEMQAPSKLFNTIPSPLKNQIYEVERRKSDGLPHRRHTLETAVLILQMGPLANRIHNIIDYMNTDLPPEGEQKEDDIAWRFAISFMDSRRYTVENATKASDNPKIQNIPREVQYIQFNPDTLDPELRKQMVQSAAEMQAIDAKFSILMWGVKVFNREDTDRYTPALWRDILTQARTKLCGGNEENDPARNAPGFVATVCVRDHWDEMSVDEKNWCTGLICSEVERGDVWEYDVRIRKNGMSADRPCAWALPILLGKKMDTPSRERVLKVFVIALTHANEEVRKSTAEGIGSQLWTVDRELALRSVNALATEAILLKQAVDVETGAKAKGQRQNVGIDNIEADIAFNVRKRFHEPRGIADDAYQTFDPNQWIGAKAYILISIILGYVPAEPAAIIAYERLAHVLVDWWDVDEERRHNRSESSHGRNAWIESELINLLDNFLLRTTISNATMIIQPIIDAVDHHPDKTNTILMELIHIEDIIPNTQQFWTLWEMFAVKVRHAAWLPEIDREYARGKEMLTALFLTRWWKDDIRHWRSLEGHVWHIHKLFTELPSSSTVHNKYVRFLYHVGEQSLPNAFILIANGLRRGDPILLLKKEDTISLLEILLQRYVYGKPLELKNERELKEAVLFILDQLVESGSSAAFRMRDDFVTPIQI